MQMEDKRMFRLEQRLQLNSSKSLRWSRWRLHSKRRFRCGGAMKTCRTRLQLPTRERVALQTAACTLLIADTLLQRSAPARIHSLLHRWLCTLLAANQRRIALAAVTHRHSPVEPALIQHA